MIKRRRFKQFKPLKTTMMSSGTEERRTKPDGPLVDKFGKSHSVLKDFSLDFSLNSQNSRVYGFENKDNIQNNRL